MRRSLANLKPQHRMTVQHAFRRRARVILLGVSLAWLAGCTTTVTPPADVARPVRIAVLDHGRHASLVLERPDESMLRYSYGDWGWYALGDTGAFEGSAAVLWPTPAGLGRKRLPGPFSRAAVAREVVIPIEHALYLTVEAEAADRLVSDLDRIFRENEATQTYNRTYDLVFVRHPQRYWTFNNSNQMVARWLEELGCRVDGPTLFSAWRRGSAEDAGATTRSTHPAAAGRG